jgi:hypothetical protein
VPGLLNHPDSILMNWLNRQLCSLEINTLYT